MVINMKRIKRIISFILTIALMLSFSVLSFAAKSTTNYDDYYEFGRLTGYQVDSGISPVGRKQISFSTSITKLSAYGNDTTLYAVVEVVLQSTGATIGGDQAMVLTNKLETGYTWECHTNRGNNNPVTSYGAHEVRGYNAYVVYTELVGI